MNSSEYFDICPLYIKDYILFLSITYTIIKYFNSTVPIKYTYTKVYTLEY